MCLGGPEDGGMVVVVVVVVVVFFFFFQVEIFFFANVVGWFWSVDVFFSRSKGVDVSAENRG